MAKRLSSVNEASQQEEYGLFFASMYRQSRYTVEIHKSVAVNKESRYD